ncbi:MAG: thioredoxin fold domain-containing protein [Chromatiaceae bacterium]|jgi:thioredoxin-related protein
MVGSIARFPALVGATLLLLAAAARGADLPSDEEIYGFDDRPLAEPLEHPDWFKESFLDLRQDLQEALGAGKRGLMVYFGQRRCAYCQKLLRTNFGLEDIVEYTRAHFDVVAIDIWGVAEVTDLQGRTLTERELAEREDTVFTPSILFYGPDGEIRLRLRGYYPPYQFRAALEYVADGHYRRESFRDYLARGDNRMVFDEVDLNDEPMFARPPYNLDRRMPSDRPLAVFFEQGDCHACDVLHGQTLRDPDIYRRFEAMETVQLNMWSDTPVITPSGERTTAREWAAKLGLFYAPSILFFDEQGVEILRVDSVVGLFRLGNVLAYLDSKAYRTERFRQWREQVAH